MRELIAQAEALDTRKLCTCDGAGRGPGRACVVQAGERLGGLLRCAKGLEAQAEQPAEPQGEPVGMLIELDDGIGTVFVEWTEQRAKLPVGTKLYAHPDPRLAALEADLVTAQQNESIEQGMRKECEAAIAQLAADLAAAQAERDDANKECGFRIKERDEARAEAQGLRVDAELSDDAIERAVRAWFEDREHSSIPVGATFIRRMRAAIDAAIEARKEGA